MNGKITRTTKTLAELNAQPLRQDVVEMQYAAHLRRLEAAQKRAAEMTEADGNRIYA